MELFLHAEGNNTVHAVIHRQEAKDPGIGSRVMDSEESAEQTSYVE